MKLLNNKILLGLPAITILVLATILASTYVSADDNTSVVDEISITVPMSCTMSGTGMDSHNTNINNGTYTPDIGTTTMNVFCNDNEGFAIYAAGYTGDEIGGTNSNKLVGTSASDNAAIESGLATSAGNPDVSNWAMKLAITQDSGDTTGTNAFVIDSAPNVSLPSEAESGATSASFSDYHVVPNEYVKVAHKNSATDMTATTGGVKLTTTYAAYISKTQPADTYSGQVIYTLVHPASHAAPGAGISVTYNSGELQFADGATTNRVIYTEDCTNATYIATTPLIAKTSNVDNDGNQSGSYAQGTTLTPITATGADKMKVVIRYGLSSATMLPVIEGAYDGNGAPAGRYEMLQGPATGTAIYTFDGDTVTFYMMANSAPTSTDGQDYGYFAEVYPIYNTEPAGVDTTAICNYIADSGTYIEPNHFKGSWTIGTETFTDEAEIKAYINEHADEVVSTGLTVTAANLYAIVYEGNTSSAGTMNGFVTIPDPANPNDASGVNNTVDLMAPNFKKTGYGFAGWSENPNAVVNGSDTIYGPNQNINAGTLTYDEDNNKSAVLYAVWVQSSGNMQNFSCNSLSANQVTALTDSRDNNVYTVGKLADGNCWMMENLRLDNTATLNSTNTDNPASGFTSIAASTDDWCTETDETCINQNKLNINNTNLGGVNASNTPLINGPGRYNGSNEAGGIKGIDGNNYSWYSYGNYYNWYTATASTGTYAQTSGNATGSICPSGWILPSGGSGGQYGSLDSAMGGTGSYQNSAEASNRWRTYPANFLYSGVWWGPAVAGGRGLYGLYWSRTADDSGFARALDFTAEDVTPVAGGYNKRNGFSVRCLAPGS
ncbi:hypothetical protein IKG49_01045 [Candidatus Saccharibacteria bacterium]|nr:hypothetical protein [Candidatus Saccharibacteria bacterium]